MKTQVKVRENVQGIRLSKELLESTDIHMNEYLNITIVNGNIVLSKTFKH